MSEWKPLTANEQEFVTKYALSEPAQLMLQRKRFPNLDIPKLVHYIQARQKIRHKLPEWYHHLGIVYPPILSL